MRLMFGDQEVIGNQEYVAGPGVNIEGNTISANIPVEEASPTDEQKDGVLYLVDEPEWVPVSVSIQEYDTEDGWHVRKWSTGYVEMVYHGTQIGGFGGWMNGAYVAWAPFPKWPIDVGDNYEVYTGASAVDAMANAGGIAYNVSTNSFSVPLISERASTECTYSIKIAGRWK